MTGLRAADCWPNDEPYSLTKERSPALRRETVLLYIYIPTDAIKV